MSRWTKMALMGAALVGAVFAAGCESDYYGDNGTYGHDRYYSRRHDSDDYYRDRDRDNYRDRSDRHWVCDSDGDNCHWER